MKVAIDTNVAAAPLQGVCILGVRAFAASVGIDTGEATA